MNEIVKQALLEHYGQDAFFVPWNRDTLPKPTMVYSGDFDLYTTYGRVLVALHDVTIDNLDKVQFSEATWFPVIKVWSDYYTVNFNKP